MYLCEWCNHLPNRAPDKQSKIVDIIVFIFKHSIFYSNLKNAEILKGRCFGEVTWHLKINWCFDWTPSRNWCSDWMPSRTWCSDWMPSRNGCSDRMQFTFCYTKSCLYFRCFNSICVTYLSKSVVVCLDCQVEIVYVVWIIEQNNPLHE